MKKVNRFIFWATAGWTFEKVVDVMKAANLPGPPEVRWSSDDHEAIHVEMKEPTPISDELIESLKEGVAVELEPEIDPPADDEGEIDNALVARSSVVPIRSADGQVMLIPIIRKTFTAVVEKDVGDGDTGKLGLTITTDEVDRYGDVIPADLWEFDNYMKNPIVLFDHQYGVVAGHPPSQAKTLKLTEKKHSIKAVIQFHRKTEFNEELYSMYREGYMNADSVGFGTTVKPDLRLNEEGNFIGLEFKGQELMEHSLVAVGANAGALQDAATKGLIRNTTRDYLTSLSPNAGTSRRGAAGKSSDKAARDEREIAYARVFTTRARLNALDSLRRSK